MSEYAIPANSNMIGDDRAGAILTDRLLRTFHFLAGAIPGDGELDTDTAIAAAVALVIMKGMTGRSPQAQEEFKDSINEHLWMLCCPWSLERV
jgi:hypothetical protein